MRQAGRRKIHYFMCAEHSKGSSLIGSVLSNRCPHCRLGRLFVSRNPYDLRTTMRMYEHCPVCGQPYELQTGFYFGTGYVSYGLSVLLIGILTIAWYLTIGMGIHDNRIFYCLGLNALVLVVLQPVLQRLARSVWIAFFVRYDPEAGHAVSR